MRQILIILIAVSIFSIPIFASAETNLLISNVEITRDGEEVKRPIPIGDFVDMVLVKIRSLESSVRGLGLEPVNTITVNRELSVGSTGEEVRDLQKILNSIKGTRLAERGPGSGGFETSYYGTLTQDAVQRFQAKLGLSVTGAVDLDTMEALNSFYVR